MKRSMRITPFKVVQAQIALSVTMAVLFGAFASKPGNAVLSALTGGAIGWIPAALFALRLSTRVSAASWVVGEVMKIGLTIAMFVAAGVCLPAINWLALLVTYIVVLKVYWGVLILR